MPSFETLGPLRQKLPNLHLEPIVVSSAKKHERLTGEKLPNTPEARVAAYFGRLEKIFLNPDLKKRERNLALLKPDLYAGLVIREDVAVDEQLRVDQKIAYERGQGRTAITEALRNSPEVRAQAKATVRKQEQSLDEWADYLAGPDAPYPVWFKYYVFRNISGLQSLVKEETEDPATGEKILTAKFPKRNSRTLKPFPDLYRGKLAKIYHVYNEFSQAAGKPPEDPEIQRMFSEKFAKVYADESLEALLAESPENMEETRGEWVRYRQGNEEDAKRLAESLRDKNTEWCTEGPETAWTQLQAGDFYAYYTMDASGEPTNPRIAIRMTGDRIAEVRGVSGGRRQEMEESMLSIVEAKLQEFGPAAEDYRKQATDMRELTGLERKLREGKGPTLDELCFLYEVKAKITGFGYKRDPRIDELLRLRDQARDVLYILDHCSDEEKEAAFVSNPEGLLGFLAYPEFVVDRQSVAFRLVEAGKIRPLMDRFYCFSEAVDHDVLAERMIAAGHARDISLHIEKFYRLSEEMSRKVYEIIIPKAALIRIGDFFDRFPTLTNETADMLIANRSGNYVASVPDKFPQLDRRKAGLAIIAAGQGDAVIANAEAFREIEPSEMLFALRQARALPELANGLEQFPDMDADTLAKDLMFGRDPEALVKNLEKFRLREIDHDYVARSLIYTGHGQLVFENLTKFQNLSIGTYELLKQRHKFQTLDERYRRR